MAIDFIGVNGVKTIFSALKSWANGKFVVADKKASTTDFGLIKIGTGLNIDDNGVVTVTGESVSDIEWSGIKNVPKASSTNVGVVKIGSGISVTTDGTISVTHPIIPTKLSELTNDKGYLVSSNIGTINGQSITDGNNITIDLSLFKVVDELPTSGQENNKIYLVKDSSAPAGNIFKEYMYVNNAWELIGEYKAAVDLSPYLLSSTAESTYLSKTVAESTYAKTSALNSYATTATLNTEIGKCVKNADMNELLATDIQEIADTILT
jgi:hypothetical protein